MHVREHLRSVRGEKRTLPAPKRNHSPEIETKGHLRNTCNRLVKGEKAEKLGLLVQIGRKLDSIQRSARTAWQKMLQLFSRQQLIADIPAPWDDPLM